VGRTIQNVKSVDRICTLRQVCILKNPALGPEIWDKLTRPIRSYVVTVCIVSLYYLYKYSLYSENFIPSFDELLVRLMNSKHCSEMTIFTHFTLRLKRRCGGQQRNCDFSEGNLNCFGVYQKSFHHSTRPYK
jgi:hypothetical protein